MSASRRQGSARHLHLDEGIGRDVRVGLVEAAPVATGPSRPGLLDEIEELRSELLRRWAGKTPAEIAMLEPARRLYKAFGIDPTKTRPSSEALLRRVLRGKPLPRILNAVDVCNLLSLRFLLPMGLYDAERIEGNVWLRRGGPEESYAGIRKNEVRLHGRPVLADGRGAFGNPTSDSLRTAVSDATRSLWMVIFAPASFPREALQRHVETAQETIRRHLAPPDAPVECSGSVIEGGPG